MKGNKIFKEEEEEEERRKSNHLLFPRLWALWLHLRYSLMWQKNFLILF